MPIHDWTRVSAGTLHDFHLAWIAELRMALNSGLLPPDYYAQAEQIVGPMGPDVLTLQTPVFISRQHAVINFDEGKLQIVDLNSSNGLYFQGKRFRLAPIEEEVQIAIGELLLQINPVVSDAVEVTHIDEKTSKIDFKTFGSLVEKLDIDSRKVDLPADMIPISQVKVFADSPPKNHEKNAEKNIEKNDDKTEAAHKLTPKSEVAPKPTKPVESIHSAATVVGMPTELPSAPEAESMVANSVSHSEHLAHIPIINSHGIDQMTVHPLANDLKPHHRVLEGYVTWKDSLYDSQHFMPGEKVVIGRGYRADLKAPILERNIKIAKYDGLSTECYIPKGYQISVKRDDKTIEMKDLLASQALVTNKKGYTLKLGNRELCSIQLDQDLQIHFRYAPAPRQLSKKQLIEASEEFRKATIVSGIFHLMLAVLALLNAPTSNAPKLKNIPERYARLLVEPPRKLIEEKKKPKPKEKEKVVKKEKKQPEKIVKKIQAVPQKVKLIKPVPSKNVAQLPPKKEPVKVETIGALGALTALAPKAAPTNVPVAINVNPNAGGMVSKNPTGGVIGILKTKTGSLAAGGGIASVKTKGLGYGTGTGYGIQGLKGTAGTRGVAGSVLGTPTLMQTGKEEGLSKSQVMDVVKRHMGEIQQCYERSLFQNPNLAGRVQYEWEIKSSGNVTWAKVSKSDIADGDNLNSCVREVFKKMKFPVAKNGQSTTPNIGLPFGRL